VISVIGARDTLSFLVVTCPSIHLNEPLNESWPLQITNDCCDEVRVDLHARKFIIELHIRRFTAVRRCAVSSFARDGLICSGVKHQNIVIALVEVIAEALSKCSARLDSVVSGLDVHGLRAAADETAVIVVFIFSDRLRQHPWMSAEN
jgi:hypothetical protein